LGLKKGRVSPREIMRLLKTSRNLQMMFAAVADLDERLSLETLFALKVEKYVICLVGTWRPEVSIIEQQFLLP
jgi:hypothetical protein